ncbi:MAG TPA: hypothetical protein VJ691_18715 [Vicinamibacterales bacterium]|nr:hypothetical protein [Vicinamibacterales bacterium]
MLIGSTASIFVGSAAPGTALGAFAEYNLGAGRYVDATWTSSDSSIIAIEDNQLVARGRGTVTLTATFEGKSDTESFTSEGGVAGRWSGSYLVEQCSGSSGSMHEILCNPPGGPRPAGIAAVGNTLPLAMEISENGTDLTATISVATVRGTLTGKNRGGGFFFLQGTIEAAGGALNIVHWDTRVTRDSMEGFIGYQLRLPNLPGIGAVGAKLVDMKRQD